MRTLLLRGEVDAARARLEAVLENDPTPENLPLLQLAHAELLLAEERWDELEGLAATMRRTGESSGARYLAAAADRAAGRVATAGGDPDEGMRLLAGAAAGFDAAEMAVDAAVTRLDMAETAYAAGDREAAERLVTTAAEPLRRSGFRREVERAARLGR
jgi:hypothetical protein